MMRGILAGLALTLIALPAWAQTTEDIRDGCAGGHDFLSCDALLQIDKDNPAKLAEDYNNRALNFGNQKRYDEAISDLNRSIALVPDQFVPYFNRGIAYEAKGQRDLAISDYRMAHRLNPNDGDIISALNRLGAAP